MAKITLKDPGANYRSTNQIKSNNDLIEAAIENTLSRDGTGPNQMEANLDMNSNRVLNLPAPASNFEPYRKIDIDGGIGLDITSVADNITDISTVADNITDVGTVSDNITDVSTVADNITDVGTVADNIDDVEAVAGKIVSSIDTIAELSARSTTGLTSTTIVFVKDSSRFGHFKWTPGDQSANVTADPEKGIWVAPDSASSGASGAWKRLQTDGRLNVKWFGAVADFSVSSDSGTNNATAFQAAINYAESQVGGGTVYVPSGYYAVGAQLTIDSDQVGIVGDGAGGVSIKAVPTAANDTGPGEDQSATSLYFTNQNTDAILIKSDFCFVRDICINSDATRRESNTGWGIHIEAADSVNASTRFCQINGVRVTNQYVGIGAINNIVGLEIDRCFVDCNDSHGILIGGGIWTSRTNKTRPGIINITNTSVHRSGGHGLIVGYFDSAVLDVPYRAYIRNVEIVYPLLIPARAVDATNKSGVVLTGENHTITTSAFDGRLEQLYTSPADIAAYNCLTLRGRQIRVQDSRFIDGEPNAARVEQHPSSLTTESVIFDNIYIVNTDESAGYYDPAISIESGCKYVTATMDISDTQADVTSLLSMSNADGHTDRFNGTERSTRRRAGSGFNFYDGDTKQAEIYWDDVNDLLKFDRGGTTRVFLSPSTWQFDHPVKFEDFVNLGTSSELTVATGSITVTKSSHTVDTEADASTDDLNTINGGSSGDVLILRAASSARTVVIKNATDNIRCGADITLDNSQDTAMFIKVGSVWCLLSSSNNAA